MSFKHLFSRSLGAAPERLHMAAHSHHLWPDASFEGQAQCWEDAASLADGKWDKVMGQVWPEAQGHVARELGTGQPDAVVFASNTHELLVRLVSAHPQRPGLRVLTSDGEFHSARRQFERWQESGDIVIDAVPVTPADTFDARFLDRAKSGEHDLLFISQVMFGSGQRFGPIDELAALARPEGPWVVIDGYHAFMAVERPFGADAAAGAFYLSGGYKYAMAGEGCGFLHAPPGFGTRPVVTGWYAEFDDLAIPPGHVGYAPDARRFLGATFDPSGLYRFNAVQRMLASEGLTTATISAHVRALQYELIGQLAGTSLGYSELLNPPGGGSARFLAFATPHAARWSAELKASGCTTDVRGEVLRVGFGLYHDADDIESFARLCRSLT
ncbi:aminotransferase class V-fold PLP-dependent enzyme [Sphingomonas piscis]|uniref:Aminotransferase class V-fold PLP-dependent enzyme n=1 Tax=Sphingomonas piscis TaxID=2714943 RepID=A0A6G7YPS9_9SPHN|nr:aminotransferase class V-fold PLP-dependent enzyme [Sphingomonas piscis]QIK78743.1 aminotransferase class V-fold PLP-dependent enzyme [Sphingomonas piscis]